MNDWLTLRDQALADIHGEIGRTVTHHPEGGADQDLRAVFTDEHTTVDETGRGGVSSVAPQIVVRLSAFDTPPEMYDEFTVDGTRYEAMDVQPDGHGSATIPLRRD